VLDLAQLGLAEALVVDGNTNLGRAVCGRSTTSGATVPSAWPTAWRPRWPERADTPVASSDRHLLGTCHDEGIPYIVLPDARGAVWTPA
jgi:hypothetical protein